MTHIPIAVPVQLRAILAAVLIIFLGEDLLAQLGMPAALKQNGMPAELTQLSLFVIYGLGALIDRLVSRWLLRDADGDGVSDVAAMVERRTAIPASEVEGFIERWHEATRRRRSQLRAGPHITGIAWAFIMFSVLSSSWGCAGIAQYARSMQLGSATLTTTSEAADIVSTCGGVAVCAGDGSGSACITAPRSGSTCESGE